MNSDVATDIIKDAVKVAPPTAISGSMIAGLPVENWVQWATLIYVVCMIVWQLFKFWDRFRGRKDTGDA